MSQSVEVNGAFNLCKGKVKVQRLDKKIYLNKKKKKARRALGETESKIAAV